MSKNKDRNKEEPQEENRGLHNATIRLSDETWEQLKSAAENERKRSGSMQTATGLARMFVEIGIANYRRLGGISITS